MGLSQARLPLKRKNVTDDGRDLSEEEWRTIPDFPKYQITSDGDLRHGTSHRILKESSNSDGVYYYTLFKDSARSWESPTSFKRVYTKLLYNAWPELAPPKTEPKPRHKGKSNSTRSYSRRGLWQDIPDFPRYQLHPDGVVRYTVSKKFRKSHKDNVEYVVLHNESGKHRRTITGLLTEVFPAAEAA